MPGAPTGLTATPGAGQVTLSWTAPADDGGSAITGYQYRHSTDGGTNWFPNWTDIPNSATATSHVLTAENLIGDVQYTVQVRTINSAGAGPGSNAAQVTTPIPTLRFSDASPRVAEEAGSVVICMVVDFRRKQATTFNISTRDGTARAGDDYIAQVDYPLGFGTSLFRFCRAVIIVDDSEHEEDETFTVALGSLSSNITLVGPSVVTVTIVDQDLTAPGAPTGLMATPSGATRIDLSWTAPSNDGGATISDYKIEVCAQATAAACDIDAEWSELGAGTVSPTTTYAHTGLAASTTRHYRVSAVNSVGTGDASAVASATTLAANQAATGAPVITGTAQVGRTLTAGKGTIADGNGVPAESTFGYQWIGVAGATETDIANATAKTYVPVAADVGKTLKVRVRFTDDAGHSERRTSAAAGPVTAAPGPTATRDDDLRPEVEDCLRYAGNPSCLDENNPESTPSLSVRIFFQFSQAWEDDPASETGLSGGVAYRVETVGKGEHAGATATEGEDFVAFSQDYTVTPSNTHTRLTQTVTLTLIDDALDEPKETFYLKVTFLEGTTFKFKGTAVDGQSRVASLDVEAIHIADDDETPQITSAARLEVDEGATRVGTLSATDADAGDTLTWSIPSGADSGAFAITGAGVLSFRAAKDYERPDDAGRDGVYEVVVQVTDGVNPVEQRLSVVLRNVVGAADPTPPATAPGAPDAPTFPSATASSLTVNWAAPTNAGPAITDYDVRWRVKTPPGRWTELADTTDSPALSATITGLTAATEYEVQVRAQNAEGTGEWSASGDGTTNAATAAAPGRVTNVVVTAGVTQLTVTWAAVSGADGYRVQWKSGSQDFAATRQHVVTGGATTSYTIPNLTAGTAYTVRVLATKANAAAGPPSVEAPGTPRAANAAPTFTAGTTATRSVAENPAAGTNVGAPVSATDADSGDTLTYTLAGPAAASFDIVSTSGQLRTKAGVPYDYETQSSYTVTVTVEDGGGGRATIEVTITLTDVAEPPGAPPGLSATAGNRQVTLSWTAPPPTGGAPILRYEYRLQAGVGPFGEWTAIPASAAGEAHAGRYRVTALTNGTTYTFEVRAVNSVGASAPVRVTGTPRPAAPARFRRLNGEILALHALALSDQTSQALTQRLATLATGPPETAQYQLGGQRSLAQMLHATLTTGSGSLPRVDLKHVLGTSSFVLPVRLGATGLGLDRVTLWGQGRYTRLARDRDQRLAWEGDTVSAQVGADVRLRPDLLTGVAVTWADSGVDYQARLGATPVGGDVRQLAGERAAVRGVAGAHWPGSVGHAGVRLGRGDPDGRAGRLAGDRPHPADRGGGGAGTAGTAARGAGARGHDADAPERRGADARGRGRGRLGRAAGGCGSGAAAAGRAARA